MLQVAFFSFVLYNIFLRLCHWKSSKSSVKQSKRELTNDTSHFRSELKIWYNSWTKKRSTRKRICQVASMTLCNLLTNTFFSIHRLLLIGAVSPTGSAKHGDKSLIALGFNTIRLIRFNTIWVFHFVNFKYFNKDFNSIYWSRKSCVRKAGFKNCLS